MIDLLTRALLAADISVTAQEIADITWLVAAGATKQNSGLARNATLTQNRINQNQDVIQREKPGHGAQYGSTSTKPRTLPLRHSGAVATGVRSVGTTVGLCAPASLRQPLGLTRALRPFKRVRRPGRRQILDLDATVDATADARRLIAVLVQEPERGLDLELIVDGGHSMSVWRETFDEFERLLTQVGAFRSVTRWELVAKNHRKALLQDQKGVEHVAERLVDPAGRRLVVLATDAVGEHWYTPAPWTAVECWARTMPTTIIQVLPPRYWSDTAFGAPTVEVRAPWPASPNRLLSVDHAWWSDGTRQGSNLVVPVAALRPTDMARWAEAIVTGTEWVTGIATEIPSRPPPSTANSEREAAERVRAFRARASQGADRLAHILASAPVLSLPLIRVLQSRLAPDTGVTELAEVFVGGLLETSLSTGSLYRFRPGVAEFLRHGVTALQEWDAFTAASDYLAEHPAYAGGLHALIVDPFRRARVEAEERPFIELMEQLAAQLGLDLTATMPSAEQDLQASLTPHRSQDEADQGEQSRSTFVVPGSEANSDRPLSPWREGCAHHERYYCNAGGMDAAYNKFLTRIEEPQHLRRDGCLVVVTGPPKSGKTSLINRCAHAVQTGLSHTQMSSMVIDLTTMNPLRLLELTAEERASRISVGLTDKLLPLRLESWIQERLQSRGNNFDVTFPMLGHIHANSFGGMKIFSVLLPHLSKETADYEIERYLRVIQPGMILMVEATPGTITFADHGWSPLRLELDYLADGEAYGLVRQWSQAHARAVQHAGTGGAVADMFAESRARLAESRAVRKDDLDKLQRYFKSRNGNIASGQLLAVLRRVSNSSVIDDTARSRKLNYVQYSEILEAWFGPTIGTDR